MASRSSMAFLQRQRIFPSTVRHNPKYAPYTSTVHFRNVVHLPELLGSDTPARRVLTQPEPLRVPYRPVHDPLHPCLDGGCTP